jgi:hypothetical protein
MKIRHKGKEYELDIDKGLASGLLKEVRKFIGPIHEGDVFVYSDIGTNGWVVTLRTDWHSSTWVFGGRVGLPLCLYSNDPMSESEVIKWLDARNGRFVGNINKQLDISTLLG